MLSRPLPEPDCDVKAQIAALRDCGHPKDAVYLAPDNAVPDDLALPIITIRRAEGTLLTTNPAKAAWFAQAALSDDGMAEVLGLPESKSGFSAESRAVVIQARDARGAVITESMASLPRLAASIEVLAGHVPAGGSLAFLSLPDALARRIKLGCDDGPA